MYDVYYAYINTYGVLKQVKVQGSVSEFGANDSYFFTGGYHSNDSHYEYSFKKPNGDWICLDYANDVKFDTMTPPVGGFGDILCYPIPADYDGDGKDDLAVQCGNTWKIAYSSDPSAQLTEYQLCEASDPLPAYVYAGGIRYQDQLDLFNHYKTDLQCGDSLCDSNSTIYDVNPPIGPYFAQCVNYWAPDANNCWDK